MRTYGNEAPGPCEVPKDDKGEGNCVTGHLTKLIAGIRWVVTNSYFQKENKRNSVCIL